MFFFLTYSLEPLACFVYLLAFLVHYRSKNAKLTALLAGYYFMATVLLLFANIPALKKGPSIWLYDLIALLTAVFLGIYFHRILNTRGKKITTVVLVIVYLAYALFRNVTLQEVRLFDSIGYSIVSASVTVYVFMYFHQLLKNVSATSILKEFNFWLASGYLIYFLGSFIIFLTYFYFTKKHLENFTQEGRELLMALWGLHNVLLFVGAFSLLIGSLWIAYRSKSVSSP